MAAYRRVYDSRHLQDQLRNPMLGNRVWATCFLLLADSSNFIIVTFVLASHNIFGEAVLCPSPAVPMGNCHVCSYPRNP